MRRWFARQFQPDRRRSTLLVLMGWAWLAFAVASSFLWQFNSKINWKEEFRVSEAMLEQAKHIEDPTERQRLLQEAQTRASRLQAQSLQESLEALRLSQNRLQATRYAGAATLLMMIPFAMGSIRQKRHQRWLEAGRCGECGYDLRASQGRCPECGASVQTPCEPQAVAG